MSLKKIFRNYYDFSLTDAEGSDYYFRVYGTNNAQFLIGLFEATVVIHRLNRLEVKNKFGHTIENVCYVSNVSDILGNLKLVGLRT